MRARRARPSDTPAIHALIAHYAAQGILLPRTEENIREQFAHFLVLEENRRLSGCVSLETYGSDLAEIRSLAVSPEMLGRGLGSRLLEFALAEARRRKIARVFAVTHAPEFFIRHGFALSHRRALPEKIARDCSSCPKARRCRLAAVIATVVPERAVLPILDEAATPAPVA
ncbi:MAG TPA: GNAT family N-acetyltransferase [Candidatus Acidoferrales bacterium]|nr:GNAT family N-acetyltransferase [Candidatus Acidoferrales bacterium]